MKANFATAIAAPIQTGVRIRYASVDMVGKTVSLQLHQLDADDNVLGSSVVDLDADAASPIIAFLQKNLTAPLGAALGKPLTAVVEAADVAVESPAKGKE